MISSDKLQDIAEKIQLWGREQGFQQIEICQADLSTERERLQEWLSKGYHGSMAWMSEHAEKRLQPEQLLPDTCRIISARMDYLPPDTQQVKILKSPDNAYVSRYALGRDYHKLIRKRLAVIAQKIQNEIPQAATQRPFVDSAPVLERPIAEKAGLGWVGKHTLLLNEHAGSWFFLGEIFTSLPLPLSKRQAENKCGTCDACLKICPTDAFVAPYQLDARRCISYLTIENKDAIPEQFREPMGNRVFGCDDCQIICPWNKFATPTKEADFMPRHNLHDTDLLQLFNWSEIQFLTFTEGSAIRRIGYHRWLRNLAVGLGNASTSPEIIDALEQRKNQNLSDMLNEHIDWALSRQRNPRRRKRKLRRADKR